MAKVKGPLFSISASGAYASELVFATWKGVQYVRQLVIPSNPKTQDQVDVRNSARISAKLAAWANTTTLKGDSRLVTDKAAISAITPSGITWSNFLTQNLLGENMANFDAGVTAYTALTAPQKTAWDGAADALTPPIAAVQQGAAGGGYGTACPSGKAFFLYQYALSLMDIADTPTGTPPTYA